ncbi:MAG: lamin tail domain-containing protein, partial [Bacteroidia bacterium]|nr:lamin tail domain-containing protein [Bacteroidia bacterium]
MTKNFPLLFVLLFLCGLFNGFSQDPWINEVHYDNNGTDTGEFIEIAGTAGIDLTGYDIVLYNGSNNLVYNTISLSGTIDDEGSGFGALSFATVGIQNGSPDGIALINGSGIVTQFLSYEGIITAGDGPASGMTSTDIFVSESSSTLAGESLQLGGTGCSYSDFTWGGPAADSPGSLNSLQTLSCATDQPDWCNIQFPVTSGIIQLGETYTVYAQVNEPGVTDTPLQGPGIFAWIGYNTTNNNPDGGAGWTWVPATYNAAEVGNNDEYFADLGVSIPATGTYYYASRFQLNSGPFLYGGSAGVWSNDSVQLTVNPHILDWCNVQSPGNGSITTGDTFDVFAQVYEPGVTDTPASQGANIEAWIGYSLADTNPSGAGWTWIAATYNPLCGATCGTPENNDEYFADIGTSLTAGTYYYASRFRIDNDVFYYGGYNAGGGGFWTSGVNVNGVLTVTDPAGSSCLEDGFDTIDGWSTHAAGNWTETTSNGTYTGNGVYVNANEAIAEYKLGFNDVDDWFELPPVDNPLLFTYWGRLSSAPGGTNGMKVQVFDGGAWTDIVEHISTLTSYVQYSANLSAYSGNTGVRIRLLRSQDDRSMYIDDIEVVCVDCTPTHTVTGFSPDSGPENTYVTITGTG